MRPLKFRLWNGTIMYHFALGDDVMITDKPVMQFTGLTDRHGKEIYEGDIVKAMFTPQPPSSFHGNFPNSYAILVEVIFDDASFLFKNLRKGKLSKAWVHKRLTDNRIDEIEIIGNIYENPELVGK